MPACQLAARSVYGAARWSRSGSGMDGYEPPCDGGGSHGSSRAISTYRRTTSCRAVIIALSSSSLTSSSDHVREVPHVGHQQVTVRDHVLLADVGVQICGGVITQTAVGDLPNVGQPLLFCWFHTARITAVHPGARRLARRGASGLCRQPSWGASVCSLACLGGDGWPLRVTRKSGTGSGMPLRFATSSGSNP